MDNIFPPYEIATLLKDNGFNEECNYHYSKNSHELTKNDFFVTVYSHKLKAPSYKQVIDWVMKEFELQIYHQPNKSDLIDVILYDKKERNHIRMEVEPEELQLGYDMAILKSLELIKSYGNCEYCNSSVTKCDSIQVTSCKNYIPTNFVEKFKHIKLKK